MKMVLAVYTTYRADIPIQLLPAPSTPHLLSWLAGERSPGT